MNLLEAGIIPAREFSLARYRFHLVTTRSFDLPANKGALFHGGLGWMLRDLAPDAYRFLYSHSQEEKHKGMTLPRPFVISPSLDGQVHFRPGMHLYFDLTLFGEAVALFPACFSAVSALGDKGLGRDRGTYRIARVEEIRVPVSRVIYDETTRKWQDPGPALTWDEIIAECSGHMASWITIECLTRLRIKEDNRLVKDILPFRVLLERLFGRLELLGRAYQGCALLDREEKHALLAQAGHVKISENGLFWSDWSRFSGSQRKWMKFGGLLGSITYFGNVGIFLPYLALGQWVHVGGKSTFGLGAYRMVAGE